MVMLWLFLCLYAATAWAFSAFIDNYASDVVFKNKTPHAMKLLNGPLYLLIGGAIALFAGLEHAEPLQIGLLMAAGALSSIASVPYYLAFKHEEATGAAIFYQIIPIIYLIADWLLFGENVTGRQILGFLTILSAPAIVIFSRKRPKSRRNEMSAALLFIVYDVFVVASGLLSTHFGEGLDFFTMFFWYIMGRGACDLILMAANKPWIERFKYVWRRKRKQLLLVVFANQLVNTTAEFASRAAMILGVAAIVSVTCNTAELIITFALGIVLSLIWPKFGREKIHRHIIIAHLLATVLAVVGIIILQ